MMKTKDGLVMISTRTYSVLLLSLIMVAGCTGGCAGQKKSVSRSSVSMPDEADVGTVHPLCERLGEDILTKTTTVIASLQVYKEHCPADLVKTALMNASVALEEQKRYLEAGYLAGAAGDDDRAAEIYRKTFAGKTFKILLRVADGGDLSVLVRNEDGAIMNRWARPMTGVITETAIHTVTMLGGDIASDDFDFDYEMRIWIEIVHVSDPELEKSFYTEHEEPGRNRPPMLVRTTITGLDDPLKTLVSRDNGGVRTSPSEVIFIVNDTLFSLFFDVIQPTLR